MVTSLYHVALALPGAETTPFARRFDDDTTLVAVDGEAMVVAARLTLTFVDDDRMLAGAALELWPAPATAEAQRTLTAMTPRLSAAVRTMLTCMTPVEGAVIDVGALLVAGVDGPEWMAFAEVHVPAAEGFERVVASERLERELQRFSAMVAGLGAAGAEGEEAKEELRQICSRLARQAV